MKYVLGIKFHRKITIINQRRYHISPQAFTQYSWYNWDEKKVYYSKIICHNWAIGDSWLKWKKCLIFSSCHININLSTRFHSSAGIMCNFSCLSSDWKVRNPHWMCTIYIFMLTFEYLTNLFTKKKWKNHLTNLK